MTRRTLTFFFAFVLAAVPSIAIAGGPSKPPKPPKAAKITTSAPKPMVTTSIVTTKVKTTHGQPKIAKAPKTKAPAVKSTTVKAAKTTTVKGTKTTTVKASAKAEKSKTKSVKTTTADAATSTSTSTSTTSTASTDTTVPLTDVQQKLKRNTNLASKLQSRLPAGTDLMKAAYGFKNLGQFVAAVNTSYHDGIPFAQLKRKMVRDGMSLGQAKQALRPSSTTPPTTTPGPTGGQQ